MRESVRRPTAARRRSLRPRTRREPGRTSRWPAARPPRSRGARAIAAAGFRRSWSSKPDADHTIEAGRRIALARARCTCDNLDPFIQASTPPASTVDPPRGVTDEHQVRQLDPAHGARARDDRALRARAGARGERPEDRLLRNLELRLRRALRGRVQDL